MNIDLNFGKRMGLVGKTAVITGGAVNIGGAISRALALCGVNTVIVYNSSSNAADVLVSDISKAGGLSVAIQADVGSEASVVELFEKIKNDERFGRVDIMVNNSGIFSMSEQTELPADEWQRLFNINSLGTFLCAREAAKMMKTQALNPESACRGAIINIASINAIHPGFGQTVHYDATKGAVYAFTRSLAAELGSFGIRVNAVAPGLVDSKELRETAGPLVKMVEGRNPLSAADGSDRLVTADDVADTIIYLCSKLAQSVTGETVVVDRGYLLS